ncbi:MAG: SCO family protein [Kofleriaceae bacterium]
MMMKMLISVLAVVACSARPIASDVKPKAVAAAKPAPSPATGPSLYDLTIAVTNAQGVREQLDLDRGHPTLISMFYGSCTAACPLLIDTLDRTVRQVPPDRQKDVRVLLVSFDPARDTPAHLEGLVRAHQLDSRWTLAAASDSDARTLAAVLGIHYRSTPDGQFFHSSAIVALDRDGRSTARMDGIGDTSALVAALSE